MTTEPFRRGDVVWHPAPFKSGTNERPYLVLSDDDHPYHGTEYAVVALTRQSHPRSIALDAASWAVGDPGGESYVSPWYVFTIKHADITRPKGGLRDSVVTEICEAVARQLGAA